MIDKVPFRALTAYRADDCVSVSQKGQHVKGRKDLEELRRNYFPEKKGVKLRITITDPPAEVAVPPFAPQHFGRTSPCRRRPRTRF